MFIEVKRDKPEALAADVLAVPLWQGATVGARSAAGRLDVRLEGLIGDYIESGDFKGTLNGTVLLRTRGKVAAPRILLLGLGEKSEARELEHLRQASATAATATRELGVTGLAVLPPTTSASASELAQAVTEGALLGLYTLKKYKTDTDEANQKALARLTLLATSAAAQKELQRGAERGQVIAEAVTLARDLGNSPGNDINPSCLASTAQALAESTSLHCRLLEQSEMEKLNMGCLLGVAQGSAQPPAFIILEHAPRGINGAPIVLVGKGLTFDSGGISIKPAGGMEDMKMDMSGGAAVLGTMQALARLNYPRRVVGLVPASENLPSGTAVKPGDILRAMSGKTVEVINTDAEGRLILADALAYAVQKYKPACIIDLATLTGAVVVALGSQATGMMGTDDDMMMRLREAGERCAERVWQLPLFDEYSKQIKSDFADIKNTGGGRKAGSIIGGAFLKEFVGDTPWVHLDIAGMAWTREGKPYVPKGSTGWGIRLLVETLEGMPVPAAKSRTEAKAKAS
jgi:leucyl aminopeptidase